MDSWEESIRRLIRSPKPAFVAEGFVRTGGPGSERAFKAVFDGRESWVIERPERAEVTVAGRTILADADEVEVVDGTVSVNNDLKVMLDGKRTVYLEGATFEDLGSTVVAGRRCLHVRGLGLKGSEHDAAFDMHIDEETGCTLRAVREPNEGLFEVTSFRVGAVGEV